ncbi:chlorohydrolase [Streptococcus pneumoniae]|uniref:hypothetical protein n=1 Tax=Streptococcus pneumoniae TaxID=1313 RepID=UPI0005E8DAF6|nr:hypothetical protein [Streptococcus pneumoniae]CMX10610.1 chlorohydrolase [Streptococcus pneumoniae]
MKTKEQTRKPVAGCSKHCFEVADKLTWFEEIFKGTDEVRSKHRFEVADRTDEISNHTYDKAKLTRFEEIFEEVLTIENKFKNSLFRQKNQSLIAIWLDGLFQIHSTSKTYSF